MSETMDWSIEPWHDANPDRAVLVLKCGKSSTGDCRVSLRKDIPAGGPSWNWDGVTTVTPSINCSVCGFHKTLVQGIWS